MKNLIDILTHFLICPLCVRCGSYQVLGHYFCYLCSQEFVIPQLEKNTTTMTNHIQVHSFLNWVPGQSDSISEWVYLLKNRSSERAWAWIVQQIQQDICDLMGSTDSVLVVPVPGSRTSFHTDHLSQQIQQLAGGYRHSLLRLNTTTAGQQKTKGLTERKQIQFKIDEDFTFNLNLVGHIVLVDDIYTTGSTLMAATKAIKSELELRGRPDVKITAIVLFRRDKSRSAW